MKMENLDGIQIILLIIIAFSVFFMIVSFSNYNKDSKLEAGIYYFIDQGEGDYLDIVFTHKEIETMKEKDMKSFMISTLVLVGGVGSLYIYAIKVKQ